MVKVLKVVSSLDLPVLPMDLGLAGVVVRILGLVVAMVLKVVPVLRPGT